MKDRELDALVAEKVMGLKVYRCGEYRVEDSPDTYRPLMHYSTSMGRAWLVVERMREEGWRGGVSNPEPLQALVAVSKQEDEEVTVIPTAAASRGRREVWGHRARRWEASSRLTTNRSATWIAGRHAYSGACVVGERTRDTSKLVRGSAPTAEGPRPVIDIESGLPSVLGETVVNDDAPHRK